MIKEEIDEKIDANEKQLRSEYITYSCKLQ